MTYFNNFPKIKSIINKKSINIIDISFGLAYDPETFSFSETDMGSSNSVGTLSSIIYNKDANNFWSLLYANEQINPWTFIQKTPSEYVQENKKYTAFYCKYTGAKLNPNFYPQLQPEDIIVNGLYDDGVTAAENLFTDYDTYFDNYGANVVVKGFGDTKKSQITQTLGSTANGNLTNSETEVFSQNLIILRKGTSGYYIANDTTVNSSGSITNLKSYPYITSDALFQKINSGVKVSPTAKLTASDSIDTIVAGDDPTGDSITVYQEEYIPISTTESYESTYEAISRVKYLKTSDIGIIVKKLI